MLTKDEESYLKKIPASKRVIIKPFDPKSKKVGQTINAKIKKALPKSKILFMGATALGIAGQNDIDIYVLSERKDFDKYLTTLENFFGKPKNIHRTFIEWGFKEDGYSVELYLTEPPKRQIKVFQILKSDEKLLKEYEDLKLKFDGKSFRDYQKVKYEFYNRILRRIDWGKVVKQFENEMLDKLGGLPGHREIPENLRGFRNIISHELPETSPKGLYRKLIKLLLKNKVVDTNKIREIYLNPELKKEQQIISNRKEEFKRLKQSTEGWVKKNLPEERLQKMWKAHKTWLPRRYTIYENHDLPFQEITTDTLTRYYLIKFG